MPLTKGYTNEIKQLTANTVLGVAANETLDTSMTKIGNTANIPLRLYASTPADSLLNVGANLVYQGDGSGLTVPPSDNTLPSFVDSTIDFMNGGTAGGVIKRDYNAFSLPTGTVGKFYRVFFVYQAVLNQVNCTFSPAADDVASLQDPGLVSASLDGQVVGYVDLECVGTGSQYKTAGSATNIIENAVSGTPRIFRFGSGGGGGAGGIGDTTAIQESLKDQLVDSIYQLLTPVVFKVDKLTYIDGSSVNAAYSYVDKALSFSAIGGSYVSINLLDDAEFLSVPTASMQDVSQVDLQVYWKSSKIDTAATYYLSRDGGSNWSEITMASAGYGDGYYYGTYKFSAESTYSSLVTQSSGASTKVLNATTTQSVAQSFTLAAASTLKNHTIYITVSGTPAGYMYLSWVAASAGLPTTTVYATSQAIDTSALSTGTLEVAMPETPLPAGTYCLVVSTDAIYKDHYTSSTHSVGLTYDTSANGQSVYNGTTWSDDGTNGLKHLLKGRALDLRLKVVSSATDVAIDGFGVFYCPDMTSVVSSVKNIQTFKFKSATDNLYQFAITSFIIDKDLCKVYWAERGLCLVYPGFQISGNTIVFPQNTFYDVLDEDVTLVVQQLEGSSFDNSDMNGALLTENHIGSSYATLDRSVSGRGILLRNANGVLRELSLDADDNVTILSVP